MTATPLDGQKGPLCHLQSTDDLIKKVKMLSCWDKDGFASSAAWAWTEPGYVTFEMDQSWVRITQTV